MPETEALAMRIKAYRKQKSKNQFEMACYTGLSIEEISLIERGKTDPKLSTLQKLAAYMGVTVSTLLDTEQRTEEDQDGGQA